MRTNLLFNQTCQVCFLTLALLFITSSSIGAPPGADAKIDQKLMGTLINSDDGTAAFFVVFGERTHLAPAYRIKDWAARGRFVADSLQATANRSQRGVRGYLQGHGVRYTPFWIENKIYIPNGTLELARELAQRPEVAAIIPEEIYKIPPPQNDSSIQSVQWNISRIGADQVWSTYGNKGAGSVVANIDTGVQYTHPALANQYRGNLGGGSYNNTGNWYDPSNICGGAVCDNNGHGTHTMGTMVGDDGGANQIGVAPGAKWIACKGCESSSCSGSALTACAQWVLAPGGNSSNRPDVVNNSWGGGSGSSWYRPQVQSWVAAGIFPAFSAGNSGPSCGTANSPGDYPESFASGATDSADNIASFSSRGPSAFGVIKPDVSAPGVSIYSSVPTNGYAYYSGTSMASPHTAGAVALLWAVRPGYRGNISATETLLEDNATILTTSQACGTTPAYASPNNTFGYGRINIKKAVDAAGGPVNQPPTVTIGTPATNGEQFNCGTGVNFVATASDPEDHDLTGSILWSGPGSPATDGGGSIYKTFSCSTELGNQTVTASVTDTGNLTNTDSVVVNIVNPNGPPSAPSGLTASVSQKTVSLSWAAVSGAQGYNVYRRDKAKGWGPWNKIGSSSTPSFTNSNLSGGNYQYYVTAYNGPQESAPSNTVSVRVK